MPRTRDRDHNYAEIPHLLAAIIIQTARLLRKWGLRSALFAVLVAQVVPAAPRAPLQTPQTVTTTLPQLCVHTRLIDEVDEWKIQRSLQLVREMGAPTIVEFFPWAYIESSDDRFDWTQPDRIVAHARNQGLRIIARMGFVPPWAQQTDDQTLRERMTLNTLPESSFEAFGEFVAAFAARYRGIIDHIIIWNEPNLAFEWGYQDVDPASYARLLQTVYPLAHAANPDVIVLAAPLAPTLEPPGSAFGMNDLDYLESLYLAGAQGSFDALAVHTYGFTHPPEQPPAADQLNFRRVELLREIMVNYGDADKQVYITESGWNDHPRWTHAVSPALRIRYTQDALALAANSWDWLETLCIWVFRFPAPTNSYPDNFTLVSTDFSLRPIYGAIQQFAGGTPLDRSSFSPVDEDRP